MDTYPTWGSSENHRLKMPFLGDMLVPWRVFQFCNDVYLANNSVLSCLHMPTESTTRLTPKTYNVKNDLNVKFGLICFESFVIHQPFCGKKSTPEKSGPRCNLEINNPSDHQSYCILIQGNV